MEILIDSFLDAFMDTIKMLPLLFIVFLIMESLEAKYGDELNHKIKKAGKLGPLIGSILGVIPQCGISVLAVGFYSKNLITIGTLISIFVSTSDEAIPLLLAKPNQVKLVAPLIVTKLILGIVLGYSVDFIFRNSSKLKLKPMNNFNIVSCSHNCSCSHKDIKKTSITSDENNKNIKVDFKRLVITCLKKLFEISLYIFLITFVLNIIFEIKEISSFIQISSKHNFLQIILTSLVGLIPNCATSVALIEVFIRGGLTFSALVSGLSSNAGLGLLILFKDKKNIKKAFYITLILYVVSVIGGLLSTLIFNFI